jgi:two-component system phosphate regulon response regulator PhoB
MADQISQPKSKILIVDDELDTLELIAFNLKNAGYETLTAEDGAEALATVRRQPPALIVLDVMLPELDGLEVCKMLKRDPVTKGIPIIMLTAKAAEVDRVLGLEYGANDYLTKPFSPRELVLRVRNLLKASTEPQGELDQIRIGEILIDIPKHQVLIGKSVIDLTATEFRLLKVLAERRGRVQSRDQLLQDVWHYDNLIDTRTVDTHMRRLREKLGPAARYLDTVRGVGYRFID